MNPGLAGAVVDPACRQLVRLVAAEFGYSQREVLEALRRSTLPLTIANPNPNPNPSPSPDP